ncbi:hypothetical protein WMF38_06830 [Sorangium sp. So ce118]
MVARIVTLPTVPVAHRKLAKKSRDELDWIGVDLGRIPAVEEDYQRRHAKKAPRVVVSSYSSSSSCTTRGACGHVRDRGEPHRRCAPRARRERGARREEHEERRRDMTHRSTRSSDEGRHRHHVRASCTRPRLG